MNKIAIIHFSPAELYPPAQNFINFCVERKTTHNIYVFTTSSAFKELSRYKAALPNIRIIRFGRTGKHLNAAARYWNYLYFNLACLFCLFLLRPQSVVYYETLSAFPACIYKKYLNRVSRLFIHYHEYTSPAEYRQGMLLNRWFHRLELSLYYRSSWLSHTNAYRMEFFKKDIQPISIPHPFILPNYPSKGWYKPASPQLHKPVRFVYVGALSLDTMYTREFAAWIAAQGENVLWNIYSYNITDEVKDFLTSLRSPNILLFGGVDYQSLSSLLKQHDVGVILYNGHIPNYIYNAPNKLFEYLACGLDVWYSTDLKGTHPYSTTGTFPKVIPVDFRELGKIPWNELVERRGSQPQQPAFFYQEVYPVLYDALTSKTVEDFIVPGKWSLKKT